MTEEEDKKKEIELLRGRLQEIKKVVNTLKEIGLNEEILEVYIAHKTKVSIKKIRDILKCERDFFEKLKKPTAEELLR